MPKAAESRLVAVGARSDHEKEVVEHHRTIAAGVEEYKHTWSTGFNYEVTRSEKEVDRLAARAKDKAPKRRKAPGVERYERNPHEPIKIP